MSNDVQSAKETIDFASTIGIGVGSIVAFLFGWIIKIMNGQRTIERDSAKEIESIKIKQECHSKDIERITSENNIIVRKLESFSLDMSDFRSTIIETNMSMRQIKDGLGEHRHDSSEYKKESATNQRVMLEKIDILTSTIARMRTVTRKDDHFK